MAITKIVRAHYGDLSRRFKIFNVTVFACFHGVFRNDKNGEIGKIARG